MRGKCYRCGNPNHRASECKFQNEFCRKCNKLGHIGKVCLTSSRGERRIHVVDQKEEQESNNNQYEIHSLQSTKTDKFMIKVNLEGQPTHMEIDTGAALSSISYEDYKELNLSNRIFKTNIQMKTYTGEIIKPRGMCFVQCTYKNQEFVGKLIIISQRVDPIFGRDWIREVSLDWAEIKSVKSTEVTRLEDILTTYEDVFQEKIGTIPSELGHLELKPDATPIFHSPRPVPYSKKLKIEQELERLEKEDIITRVDHSDWGTPIVAITKPNGDVRVCADYKVTLNRSIQDFNYPIPRIEDIFAQMNGDLASLLHPLNNLLRKGEKFHWTDQCEKSFQKVKEQISNDNVLVHYNPDLPVTLATDASPVGLGAVLSHRYDDGTERPIAFASRSLTKCERNYSQIDREATGIYWGIKKFFQYLYGRKFILITDNKPLTTIFNPCKMLPTLAATRMFHYALFLSGFDYSIEYKRTSDHGNADFLSRFPFETPDMNEKDETYRYQTNQINVFNSISFQKIQEETKRDTELSNIVEALANGNSLQSLGLDDSEYTLQDGCVFRGMRVVIPASLRKQVLEELHVGHLGIVKMKSLSRSFCYWKRIDTSIEDMVRTCKQCCMKQNEAPKSEVHPWEQPQHPWGRIHIDFAGPENGLWYFIVVDAHTKWVEVIPTKTTTSEFCIRELRKLFSTFGLPVMCVSDNGAQFKSHEFENFLQSNFITHRTTAAFHPATNGQAERFVQTIKKHLKAMSEERGDINLKISRLLMQLRKVKNSEGESPYTMMFGRDPRTRLDAIMKPVQEKTENMTTTYHGRCFNVNDRVQVRNYTNNKKWEFGTVKKREGLMHYVVTLDDGREWRRHVDQVRLTHYRADT
ncbi:hypothetical protein WDU94_009845 [Cyamophila willieti]